jgi:DNA-directed RNA polymerase specialized sigma subunit
VVLLHDEIIDMKKRWLYRYRNNQSKIEQLHDKLEALEERIVSIKAPNYSGISRGATPITLADLLSDKEDLQKRINRLSVKGTHIKNEILEAIDTLEHPKQAEVLEYWFINGYNVDQINELLSYSSTYIYRLYSGGLKNIEIDSPSFTI